MWVLTLLDFKSAYKTTVIKTVCIGTKWTHELRKQNTEFDSEIQS